MANFVKCRGYLGGDMTTRTIYTINVDQIVCLEKKENERMYGTVYLANREPINIELDDFAQLEGQLEGSAG